jgi:hypothetical protein
MTDATIRFSQQMPGRSTFGKHTNLRMKDGTTYNGTIVAGERNGFGLFRSTPLMYGVVRSSGEELIHWTEYYGEWRDDMPHGFGILRNVSGDGNVRNVFEGSWLKGLPESSAFYGL